jgi:hypothetical protein
LESKIFRQSLLDIRGKSASVGDTESTLYNIGSILLTCKPTVARSMVGYYQSLIVVRPGPTWGWTGTGEGRKFKYPPPGLPGMRDSNRNHLRTPQSVDFGPEEATRTSVLGKTKSVGFTKGQLQKYFEVSLNSIIMKVVINR